jgi:hypothetical protein
MPDQAELLLNPSASWILVFGHPGHELRAYHLLERVRPSVLVLTDGSGSTPEPRVKESLALLADAGARPAARFGPLADREAYAALMTADAEPFLAQLNWLVDTLLTDGAQAVLVDAAEGYNPVHDVCHWMGRAAVDRARQFGIEVALFELDLIAHPDPPGDGLRLRLDDEAFARKLNAAARYAALKAEAQAAFDRYGQDAFRVEFLRDVIERPPPPASWIPYYEEVGEARVRTGTYTSVLRYGTHVKPVIERLLESVRPAQYATDFRTPDE